MLVAMDARPVAADSDSRSLALVNWQIASIMPAACSTFRSDWEESMRGRAARLSLVICIKVCNNDTRAFDDDKSNIKVDCASAEMVGYSEMDNDKRNERRRGCDCGKVDGV